jgi:hypothetical protein
MPERRELAVNDVHEIASSLETGDEHVLTLPEPWRCEGLSDAAFSIIVTLLVLKIHRPNSAGYWPAGFSLRGLRIWPMC